MCLFIWLALIRILYNKTIILNIVFSWVLWVVGGNYLIWGVHGKPPLQICGQLVRSEGGLGTPKSVPGIWSEASLVGPVTCGVGAYSKWSMWELNAILHVMHPPDNNYNLHMSLDKCYKSSVTYGWWCALAAAWVLYDYKRSAAAIISKSWLWCMTRCNAWHEKPFQDVKKDTPIRTNTS